MSYFVEDQKKRRNKRRRKEINEMDKLDMRGTWEQKKKKKKVREKHTWCVAPLEGKNSFQAKPRFARGFFPYLEAPFQVRRIFLDQK
jgi:hypothetical protein